MSSILPVYFLPLLLCADAYFLKFWQNGERRFAPKAVIYRDDYVDYYWPEDNTDQIYSENSKRSLAGPSICCPETPARKPSKNVERALPARPKKASRKMQRRRSGKCRRSSRRSKSLLSRTLHARHDDTKYDVQPYSAPYQYPHANYLRNFGIKRQKGRRKEKCKCRSHNRNQMMCADVGYFHQVFAELERMMRKFLLERVNNERDITKSEDRSESLENPSVRAENVEEEEKKVVKDHPDEVEEDSRRMAEKKKPFLHV